MRYVGLWYLWYTYSTYIEWSVNEYTFHVSQAIFGVGAKKFLLLSWNICVYLSLLS